MADKTNANIGFEKQLWDAACVLWGRYVGIEEQEDDGELFEDKMKHLTSELSELFAKFHELEDEIRKKLGAIGYEL